MNDSRAYPFTYPQFREGQIRVLTILPGQAGDPPACKLEHIQSDDEHTCLS